MDFIWILVAFLCGFLVKQVGMPPLVGYLAAGFGMHALGMAAWDSLETLAELGITLMLFTIGLKINVKSLLKPQVWGVATLHSSLWIVLATVTLLILGTWLGVAGLGGLFDLPWVTSVLIAFAFSFSSTVCVIKILEDKDELKTTHGKLAVGVLVIQDIIAVAFLVVATGKVPSPLALLLLLLIPARPLLNRLMEKGGHGELLPLMGFFLALGGAEIFDLVNIKGDLGALLVGMLLSGLPKAAELYKSLMSFKDLFLIGFFMAIGFSALPDLDMLLAAVWLSLLLPVKFALFFLLFVAFRLRARESYLAALGLMNFSEFGLIVADVAVKNSWLSQEWLVVIAMAVSFSFVWSTLAYLIVHRVYARYRLLINRFQRKDVMDAQVQQPVGAEVLVIGMGRVGSSTYEALDQLFPGRVWGMDADAERVKAQRQLQHRVILGDADDADFLARLDLATVSLVMLAIPSVNDMRVMIEQLRGCGFNGRVAAVARYDDERKVLLNSGADAVYGYFAEVGKGFAGEASRLLNKPQLATPE